MKNIIVLYIALCMLILGLSSCTEKQEKQVNEKKTVDSVPEYVVQPDFDKNELDEKFGTTETYIVKTYLATPSEYIEDTIGNGLFIRVTHYQLSDGTWKTDDHSYKYKLVVSGRMNNAVKDSTYHILSNRDVITFEESWKAAGYSSNSEDYFKPEDAIIVAIE